mgnify:CR=1 FL=1
MTLRTFPLTDFPAETLKWRPTFASITGGRPISGPAQRGEVSGGGWWQAAATGIDLGDDARIRQWLSLMLAAADGVEAFIVPMLQWPVTPGGTVTATVAAEPLRETTLAITTTTAIGPGHCFSIDHATVGPRIYMIKEVDSVVGDLRTCHVGPPLRQATTAGMSLDFNTPRCVMRVVDPSDESWPAVTAGWASRPSIAFEETFETLS